MLTVLSDTGIREVARVCLLKHCISTFKFAKDMEDKTFSMLAPSCFIHDPEELNDLIPHMKDILKALNQLKRSCVLSVDMLKVFSDGSNSSIDLWNHKELAQVDCRTNGSSDFGRELRANLFEEQVRNWDTEIVDFSTADQPRELRIRLDLSIDERDNLIQLLRAYLDVFTWSYEDMPGQGGDSEVAQCRIFVSGQVPGVVGQCRHCSQKRTASQILMAPNDMEKTSFITEWGTYCYRVMPFGLKNVGATYQRAVTTLFHDMMHRDVEVYVDDMIVKSRGRLDHLSALEKFFERIRQFKLRLNPKKCTFGVTSGKLLGYMVSERGIEVDPDKIRAILDMPAPRTEREVRGFLGRLQYISRFIARLIDICEPIFRLLRKSQPTVWDYQCQSAFERIREYLLSPPVLAPPTPGRPLLLYLSVSDVALGCMLAQLDDLGKD
ncbi:hypothetical protein VitviT2T_024949 [Vitis vinifera]|uniref:Retrovirus-related Pol polyprotein from transposon 17.6 n=1 Tax=Vitis vinifera TaxID=29760 RepID=A0ABY9DH85_VITVI|nr:hypothetical protein VitviT2T_024949 [Vitis vinifera]